MMDGQTTTDAHGLVWYGMVEKSDTLGRWRAYRLRLLERLLLREQVLLGDVGDLLRRVHFALRLGFVLCARGRTTTMRV